MNPADEALLEQLVARGLARRDQGLPPAPDELCADRPDLLPAVREALGLAGAVAGLQRDATELGLLQGKVLGGRYELQQRLGAGASGVVHAALDRELGRKVAVKLLQRAFLRDEDLTRFLREAEILARLEHPHVVPIHDRGQSEEGWLYLVMPCLEGETLAARLARGPLPVSAACQLGAAIGEALAAAHAQGVFHRDVKPSNVFVTSDQRALLLDFGIATRLGEGSLTVTGTTLGSPWYMAPEQAVGRARNPGALDVYGLAATLYHALAGRPPYEGTGHEVLVRLVHEAPPPLAGLRPELPRDLVAIVEKGCERAPERRYAGAAQMVADLRAFHAGLPVAARPITTPGRWLRAARRRPARTLAVALLGVVLLLAVALGPGFAAARANSRRARQQALEAQLPALVALEGQPEERGRLGARDRAEILPLLAELLALDPDDVTARLLRAALLADGGDPRAAAADLDAVARRFPGPYFMALAAAFRVPAPIDPAQLPTPERREECYAQGFLLLRRRTEADVAAALAVLEGASEYAAARDLRLLALLACANQAQGDERRRLFDRALEAAIRLEGERGHPTARTRHTLGAALVGLGRYDEAIAPLRECLRLRPDRHGPLQNLGIALHRLGRFTEAEACLRAAQTLEPTLWNTTHTLAQVQRDRGEFATALATAAQLPTSGPDGIARKRALLLGGIHQAEALDLFARREVEASRAAASKARTALEEAMALGAPAASVGASLQLLEGLQQGDVSGVVAGFAQQLARDPLLGRQVHNLARLLPRRELSSDATAALRQYLMALAQALGGIPGEPAPAAARPLPASRSQSR